MYSWKWFSGRRRQQCLLKSQRQRWIAYSGRCQSTLCCMLVGHFLHSFKCYACHWDDVVCPSLHFKPPMDSRMLPIARDHQNAIFWNSAFPNPNYHARILHSIGENTNPSSVPRSKFSFILKHQRAKWLQISFAINVSCAIIWRVCYVFFLQQEKAGHAEARTFVCCNCY